MATELTKLDYYTALDLPRDASPEQIERAYALSVESFGPASMATYGLLRDEERDQVLAYLHEARRVLLDVRLRDDYDRRLGSTDMPPAPLSEGAVPPSRAKPVPKDAFLRGDEARATPVAISFVAADAVVQPPPRTQPERAPASAPSPALAKSLIPALDGRPLGGNELREIREWRGFSIEEVSARTKISTSTLRFLETSNFAFLPAPVYVKGFLRTYAKLLQIDAEKLVADYMRTYEAHRGSQWR